MNNLMLDSWYVLGIIVSATGNGTLEGGKFLKQSSYPW